MGRRKRRNMRGKKDDSDENAMDMDEQSEFDGRFKVKLSKKLKKALRKRESQFGRQMFSNIDSVEQDFDDLIYNQMGKKHSKISKKLLKKIQRNKIMTSTEPARDGQGFHMITFFIQNNSNVERNFLLNSIGNYVNFPFVPLGFFKSENSFSFYLEPNSDVAESVKSLNRKLQSPTGELMGIKVSYVKDMDFILNCDQLELIKVVMAERYESENGLLNLSSFYTDSRLIEANIFAPLSNNQVLKQACQIIRTNMPDIKALDVSNNKLKDSSLKYMEGLQDCCRSLFAINLEKNYILNFRQLRYFRNLPLKELKISESNTSKKKLFPKYVKSVRKELPFLKILDGHEIGTELISQLVNPSFEIDNVKNISGSVKDVSVMKDLTPPSLSVPTSLVNEEKLKTFLEQYYSLIDNPEGRVALIQAYIPTAKIEIRSENPLISSGSFVGHVEINSFLSSWPATTHDHSSFNLKILSLFDSEGVTQVEGFCFFREPQIKVQFKRVMKIIPFNAGFCCCSDLLEIK